MTVAPSGRRIRIGGTFDRKPASSFRAFPGQPGTVAKILDIEALLTAPFRARTHGRRGRGIGCRGDWAAHDPTEERRRLVTFDVAGQEYAFASRTVQESSPRPATSRMCPGATRRCWASWRIATSVAAVFLARPAGIAARIAWTGQGDRHRGRRTLVGLVVDRTRAIISADRAAGAGAADPGARAGGEAQIMRDLSRRSGGG